MKAVILKFLAFLGLAPAGRVTVATTQARDAAKKVARLEERLASLRADAQTWKGRHYETAHALATLKDTAARAEAANRQKNDEIERLRRQADEWRAKAEKLSTDIGELRERLVESRRIGTLAREHLMATEVKLDLIEAAIQILDARTRDTALKRQ